LAPGPSTGTRARARPLTEAARRFTAEQFTQAERFLAWLDQHDRRLGDCAQADLDAWCAQAAEHHKRAARMFLTWAITTHHMPNLALPTLNIRTGERLTQTRRLALLRRVLTDDGPPTPARAAAALILVYAQPATRIVRLTIDDILDLGDQMLIRLGEPPSPVPDPLANILRHLRHLVAGVPARPALPSPPVDGCFLAPGPANPPTRATCWISSVGSASPRRPPGLPSCASSSSKRRRPSSPTPSATTPSRSPRFGPKQAAPGRPTPRRRQQLNALRAMDRTTDYSVNGADQPQQPTSVRGQSCVRRRPARIIGGRSVQRTLGGRCFGLVQVSALRDMVGVAAVATELVSFIDWPVR